MFSKKNRYYANPLEQKIDLFLNKINLISHQTVILGLSGGPDSVALLHLLTQKQSTFKYQLIAAHLDHQWRTDSHQDAIFCQELCNKLNIKLICEQAINLNFKPKATGSKEDLGRQLRRYFFNRLAQKYQAKYIALAHHLDDQIETFFIRLIRGSTLTGLSCMQAQSGIYLRPLLNTNKQEILTYLQAHNLAYLQDSTNSSPVFLRNRVRFLLPELEKVDSRFKANFSQTLNQITQASNFILELAQSSLKQVSLNQESQIIDLKLFNQLKPFLQNQVILSWLYYHKVSFTQTKKFVREILKFFNSKHGGTHQVNPNWSIVKKQNLIEIQLNLCGAPRLPDQYP
jgi:tRNA(Ile)-lysidine synthase